MCQSDNYSEKYHYFMGKALELAEKAARLGEVPVGAVLTYKDCIVSTGFNAVISGNDPTAHAEIAAIRDAAAALGNYRLPETNLYVTLEPCIMCMGAIIHARIKRLVFGAFDPKTGAASSVYSVGSDNRLNHRLEVAGGIMADECGGIIREFFRQKRAADKNRNRCFA
ncbi:MAG: tRNA adenosine(34) deaminase TadA [Deltaproteobacteria bacterium]|nr:MAG: tRNA adenosine(34) deaminase TadA [Deltaproteobacteria bacterium]